MPDILSVIVKDNLHNQHISVLETYTKHLTGSNLTRISLKLTLPLAVLSVQNISIISKANNKKKNSQEIKSELFVNVLVLLYRPSMASWDQIVNAKIDDNTEILSRPYTDHICLVGNQSLLKSCSTVMYMNYKLAHVFTSKENEG